MTCPVCGARIKPLAEYCGVCNSHWIEGQAECPAILDLESHTVQCEKEFRHKSKSSKHLYMGKAILPHSPAVTYLWHYPLAKEAR